MLDERNKKFTVPKNCTLGFINDTYKLSIYLVSYADTESFKIIANFNFKTYILQSFRNVFINSSN